MGKDMVPVMKQLGFEQFSVAGHDRGGRVAYRMALDHPGRVEKLAVLDILPTLEHYRRADMAFATAYWHWFFLIQPFPLPEKMIGADPEWYFRKNWPGAQEPPTFFDPAALADYWRAFSDPRMVHAMCEDYRAGATYDLKADEADFGRRKIECPLLVLWGAKGVVGRLYDPLAVWRDWGSDVRGEAIDAGHYLAEEKPQETFRALREFLQ